MRKAVLLVVLVAALAPAAASGLSSASRVYVVGDCKHEQYKPTEIVISCGDGNDVLKGLSWSAWTASKATGAGTNSVNTCTPSCAGGHFKSYAVTVTLSGPRQCRKAKHKVFGTAALHFTGARPSHVPSTQKLPIACPL